MATKLSFRIIAFEGKDIVREWVSEPIEFTNMREVAESVARFAIPSAGVNASQHAKFVMNAPEIGLQGLRNGYGPNTRVVITEVIPRLL